MMEKRWAVFRAFAGHSKGRWFQSGQSSAEYGLLIAGVGVVLIAVLALLFAPTLIQFYNDTLDYLLGTDDDSVTHCVPDGGGSSGGSSGSTAPAIALPGEHRFELSAWIYDGDNDSTTVAYMVTSGDGPSISHWTLEVPACLMDPAAVASASEAYEFVNPDPTSGAVGIKFDQGYEDNESRVVFITFHGDLDRASGSVVTKAAEEVHSAVIQVPGWPIISGPSEGTEGDDC